MAANRWDRNIINKIKVNRSVCKVFTKAASIGARRASLGN